MTDPVALCATRLAAGDPDRLAATLALPVADRPMLLVLYAANLMLAQAPWASREPLVAEMRLQWWVDALEALAGRGAPVPHEIGPALRLLPDAALHGLLTVAEARRADCRAEGFADPAQLWQYLEATSGALMLAAGACLGTAEGALRDFGTGQGLANWLIALPELTARGRLTLAGAADLRAVAAAGERRCETAAKALRQAPWGARAAALAGWQTRAVLRRAQADPEAIAAGTLRGSEFSRRFGLMRARMAL